MPGTQEKSNLNTNSFENYYSKENILKFATFLYQNGEDERAIGEYTRVMALCDDARLKDTLLYRIAVANVNLLRTAPARNSCAKIPVDTGDSLLAEKAACLSLYSWYLEKKFDTSALFASRLLPEMHDDAMKLRASQIRVAALLKQYRWNEAAMESAKALQIKKGKPDDTLLRHLHAIGVDGTDLHMKSAFLAGVMSGAVPGSGKVYAGRAGDGLVSFFIVGIMALQSYEGYKKDGLLSVRCITFGLLGSAFYGGNIWGSINAAHLHNQSRKRALCDRINLRFDW
jgi:hypothetical protein